MRPLMLTCLSCFATALSGCLVSTPVHHLPQGYSESYRQILRKPAGGLESIGPVEEAFAPAMTLPALPIETPEQHEVEFTPPVEVDGPESSETPLETP